MKGMFDFESQPDFFHQEIDLTSSRADFFPMPPVSPPVMHPVPIKKEKEETPVAASPLESLVKILLEDRERVMKKLEDALTRCEAELAECNSSRRKRRARDGARRERKRAKKSLDGLADVAVSRIEAEQRQ